MNLKKQSLGIITILLILRIPILFLGQYGYIDENMSMLVYFLFTYLFTAMFIYLNIDNLEDYFITKSSVIIFLISPVIFLILMGDDLTFFLKLCTSAFLLLYLLKKNYFSNKGKIKINIIYNIAILILFTTLVILLKFALKGSLQFSEFEYSKFFEGILFQLTFAAINEEPLFRGMIMGYLIKSKVSVSKAILVQAMFFWFAHIYYINTGLNFWIIHPIGAVMLGVVSFKSKTITNSMIFHSLINSLYSMI